MSIDYATPGKGSSAQVVAETKRRVVCPACGKPAGAIDHMIADAIRRGEPSWICGWFCDSCGWEYHGHVFADGTACVEKTGKRKIETRVLLKLDPAHKPIFIEVEGMRFEDPKTPRDEELPVYFYEEHSCTSNHLRAVHTIWEGNDPDPHGIFKVVDQVDAPPEHTGVPADEPFPNGVFAEQVARLLAPDSKANA